MSIQRDSWWMDTVERKHKGPRDTQRRDMRGILLLLSLIALSDSMVWQVTPGLSLAVFALCLVGCAALLAQSLSPKRAMAVGATALVAVAPIVELVQPLSVLLLVVGLLVCLCLIAGVKLPDLTRAASRYAWAAGTQTFLDTRKTAKTVSNIRPPELQHGRLLKRWTVPACLGIVFALLLINANPILSDSISRFARNDWPNVPPSRLGFWLLSGCLVWSVLIAHRLHGALTSRLPERHMVHRPGLINAASVTRSLILFNAMFAVQTLLDAAFLYGATELPEGMSYATYAHRGAYPLLATALLAGVFAILARPFTDNRPLLRKLLVLWLVQNVALVIASLTRLEVYVDVYGLTRLRVAATIWMFVVAGGLGLVIWQVIHNHNTGWMLKRASLLGLAALYVASFLNIDGIIATYNLTRAVKTDRTYLCSLSETAILPIERQTGQRVEKFCHYRMATQEIHEPTDWREWGFRNARLRSSLAALRSERTTQ